MNLKFLPYVFILLIFSCVVIADQTQLYSKIYLSPYYREATISGVQYNYTLSVNPPDGLTQVFSGTITFEAYLSPSVNFTLKVNNQSCNTPNYYVSTTYATSGQGTASFDCSNIIKQTGNYTVQLTMSKNTGAINGWIDLTYTNKKKPTLSLSGTEYQPFDETKVFLQLLEGDVPVNNASCYVSIYYPNNTLWQNNQSMIYQNGTNGLYWWSGVAPNVTGVYMVDSRCRYDYFQRKVYPKGTIDKPTITTTSGSQTGSILSINDYEDSLYLQHLSPSSAGHYVDFYADFNITDSNYTASQIDIYWLGQSSTTDKPLVLFYAWNWTSSAWVLLPNNITLYGTKSASIEGVNELVTNTLTNGTLADYVSAGKMVRIRVLANLTTNYYLFTNWFSLGVTAPTNMYLTDIRGGGEIHITSPAGQAWWTAIITWLSDIWNKLLGIETQLNTTINITANINTTANLIKNDTTTIINKIDDLNASMIAGFAEKDAHIQSAYDNMTSQVTNLSQNVSQNFNTTWQMIQALNTSEGGENTSQILSYLQNLTLALNNTQTQLANVNQSLTNQIINSSNNTNILINNLNISSQARFDQLQSFLENLTIQISNNQNMTQMNITQLQALMQAVNLSLSTDISNLNVSLYNVRSDLLAEINQTGENIVGEINSLKLLLLSINQSLTQDIIENRNTMLLINSSLSTQMNLFESATSGNFNTTFALINGLEAQNNLTHSLLGNLSLQLNQTNWDIQSRIDLLNQSVMNRFDNVDNSTTTIISILTNMTIESNTSIQGILDMLSNLSVQVDSNHNITQNNISTLFNKCDQLNDTMTGYYLDLNESIANLNSTIIQINNTVTNIDTSVEWIMQVLNISSDDLNLYVIAPNKCLENTNWLAKATLRDRYGVILSPVDEVQCNMTTDLWGTANMSYSYVEQNFKYIHVCDPANTTFNWSVECGWT